MHYSYFYFSIGILYIPRSFLLNVYWDHLSLVNDTVALLRATDFYESTCFYIYNNGVVATISVFIPTITISICSFIIIFKLEIGYSNVKAITSYDTMYKRRKDLRSIKITLSVCLCVMLFVLIPTSSLFTLSPTQVFFNELLFIYA